MCRSLDWFLLVICLKNSTKDSLGSNVSESEIFTRAQRLSVEFCNGVPVTRRKNSLGTKVNYLKTRDLLLLRWCVIIQNESLPSTTRIIKNCSLNVDVTEATVHRVWPQQCTGSAITQMKTKPALRLHTLSFLFIWCLSCPWEFIKGTIWVKISLPPCFVKIIKENFFTLNSCISITTKSYITAVIMI